MRRIAPLLALLFMVAFTTGCGETKYKNISNEELQTLMDKGVTVVDIRRPEEWLQTGVVRGSKTITLFDGSGRVKNSFFPKLEQAAPDKTAPIVLICRTGNRTQAGSEMLVDHLGYTNVHNVRDGITAWIMDNRVVERINPRS